MEGYLTVIFTGVIALMAILQWLVFLLQRNIMRDQRNIMDGQLATMDKQLGEMKTTSEQLNQLVKQAAINAEIGKESADAAKQSADAAQISAIALQNSERAWIMVELEWAPGNNRRMLSFSGLGEKQISSTTVGIRLTYTNEGKTIAWVDEKRACFQIVKELPKQPDLAALQMIDNEPEWAAPTGGGLIDHIFVVERQEGMGDLSVIWGIISYRDAFAGTHTTVFGFRITPDNDFERIAGLAEYNKNT